MPINLVEQEWYSELIEECKNIITETIFTSRWALVEGYHKLGERILEENDNFERVKIYGQEIVQRVATSLEKSGRTIQFAIQFAKKYPSLDSVPEGKNISWHKICNKYLPAPKEKSQSLPKGKYSVVYADPPWPYSEHIDPKNLYGAANYHYERMPIKDLCALPVKDLLLENAVLFIWVATNFLEDSFKVIKDWGFEYKSQMVWVKTGKPSSIGYYVRAYHELLLIATKGSFLPKTKEFVKSVIEFPIQKHSQKPEVFYDIIEKLYPDEKYVELFLRGKPRKGWVGWGKESLL